MPCHKPNTYRPVRKKQLLNHLLIAVLLACLPSLPTAQTNNTLDDVLALTKAPEGVVFEIVSGDREMLDWAIPLVRDYSKQLRRRFPRLEIAVVSHGTEQFALMSEKKKKYAKTHQAVEELVKKENIQVHVCETYAGWKGVSAAEFPDYIDVAPAGPAQINNYRQLGYLVILIKKSLR